MITSSLVRLRAIHLLLLGLLWASASSAQTIPALGAPSTLSGGPTTSEFFAGAHPGSSAYASAFSVGESVIVDVAVNPEAAHVGSAGKIVVLAAAGTTGAAYAYNESAGWTLFDGTVEGLGSAQAVASFAASNEISLAITDLLNQPGVQVGADGNVPVIIYVAYDTSANVGELYYSGVPLQFVAATNQGGPTASEIFAAEIEPLVQARCIVCHVSPGVADDTGLVYQRSSATSAAANFATYEAFAASRSDALEYILSKASGGDGHQGGPLLAVGSSDYNKLSTFLDVLLNGSAGGGTSAGKATFFTGVNVLSTEETLRRAAIILAGRAPSDAEYAAVANGSDASLRATVRGLMQGEGFHDFLLNGANDRLLVRGVPDDTFLDGDGVFPNYLNTRIDLTLAARAATGADWNWESGRFDSGVDRGLEDSPLELIAHVVENERPYSEILTADYMMLNPIAAFAMGVTGNFDNPDDYGEFQPVKIDKYYSYSGDTVDELDVETQQWRVLDPGSVYHPYPHAGVLNTQAFLFRYPTTATNRNRARARWTFLHFLDVDIEKSAPRTTDPVALADTNNPTMYNPNCTVCHASMDPVAGAFALYGEEGHFRTNADDSLDLFYKDDENSLYQPGDIWYRDMREAGVLGVKAPAGQDSLQWLAQQIVQQPGFATATVKFWWPAVIGTEPLLQPEVQSDANYAAKLMAFNAQSETIQGIANRFSSGGMNLKDLLVDLVMTPWFRASTLDDSNLDPVEAEAHAIADLGSERLLTPWQLASKTESVTGFRWQRRANLQQNREEDGLSSEYKLYYGGIDSQSVTKRSREMTALMSQVAMMHAAESACPIVLKDFALLDGSRKLFNGISDTITPLTEGAAEYAATTVDEREYQSANRSRFSTTVTLDTSPRNLFISTNLTACLWNEAAQQCDGYSNLSIDRLDIRAPNGMVTSLEATPENTTLSTDCAWYQNESDVGTCEGGRVNFPYQPGMSGNYEITAVVLGTRYGNNPLLDSVELTVGAESTSSAANSTANGANQIRNKIVELYADLHGEFYAPNSAEVEIAYQLYADTWEEFRADPEPWRINNLAWGELGCNIWNDYKIGEGLPIEEAPYELKRDAPETGGWRYIDISPAASDYFGLVAGRDNNFAKRGWVSVMTYLLSHYDYLYE